MKFVIGKPYYLEAVDHSGSLGDPDTPRPPAILPALGWYAGEKMEHGIKLAMFVHIGSPDDKDTWTTSLIIKNAIVKAKRIRL